MFSHNLMNDTMSFYEPRTFFITVSSIKIHLLSKIKISMTINYSYLFIIKLIKIINTINLLFVVDNYYRTISVQLCYRERNIGYS